MTIEIDFSFEIDGLVESINYYRSETSMDPEAMPAPTATGITGTEYTDTTAIQGEGYYVRFGSVRGSEEKISDEIFVYASTGDLYFAFVDLLIVKGVSVAPVDSSSHSRSITSTRNATRINDQFFINGLEDRNLIKHISQPAATSTNYSLQQRLLNSALGTADFTLEIVGNLLEYAHSNFPLFLIGAGWGSGNGLLLAVSATGVLNMYPMSAGSFTNPPSTGPTMQLNVFKHICIQRISGIFYLYVDGVLVQTQSSNTTLSMDNANVFLCSSNGYKSINAAVANARITLGARYTQSGFTPSLDEMTTSDSLYASTRMLLSSNGSATVDSASIPTTAVTSTNVTHIPAVSISGNGRFYNPSSNNTAPVVTIQALGTSDFTIQLFAKALASSASVNRRLFQIGLNASGVGGLVLAQSATGNLVLATINSGVFTDLLTVSNADPTSFNHYCVQRKDGVFYLYKDGVQVGVNASYTSYSITQTSLYLLGSSLATECFNGILNGFRLTKGVARYNVGGFTPPTLKFPTAA